MKNTSFKYGVLSALILGGFIAVYALFFSGFFTRSEAAIKSRPPNSPLLSARNGHLSGNSDIADLDVPETEYRERLARIRQFGDTANFEELVKEGDEIQAIWGTGGGERYAKLILELISAIGFSRILDEHPEARDLREEYATAALARSDSYSIESELHLALELRSVGIAPSATEPDTLRLRDNSKLWLHLLSRLERDKDPAADPYLALQKQIAAPDDPRWYGVSDSASMAKFEAKMVEYNAKQKWLSDQYTLRNVSEIAEPRGTKFLARVYSRPPFSREELSTLLSESPIAKSLRQTILKARDNLLQSNHP